MSAFFSSSLRARLLILVILAIIPTLGLLVYTASEQRNQKEIEIRAETMRTAKLAANNIEQLLEGAHQILEVLSELPAVQNHDAASCNAYFADFKKKLPMYGNIAAIDLKGDIFCSATPLKKKVNVSDRLYFQTAVQKKQLTLGEYQLSRIDNRPTILLASPVLDKTHVLKAVVYVAIDLAWFKEQLNKIKLPDQSTLTIVDHSGTLLYRYPDPDAWMGKSVARYSLAQAILMQNEGISVDRGVDDMWRIYAFTPVQGTDNGMHVVFGTSRAAAFFKINQTLMKSLLTLLVIAGLTLALAWIGGSYFILRRMKVLTKATEDLSQGNLGVRVNVAGHHDEISQLGDSFNGMAEALERQNEERKKSEKNYRTLFEESKDAIFISTPQGRYLDVNPAAIDLLGYASKEEMLRLDINTDIFVNPEDRKAYMQVLEERGFVKDYELEFKRKDGKKLTVLSTVTALRNDEGVIIAYRGINHDITERKRLEQQLKQAQKMEAVGQLAGGIAHDFNNVLSAILGYGELLKRKIGTDATAREYAEQILTAGGRAAEVTRSLLAFSRKQVMNPTLLNINDLILKFKKLLSRIIGEDIEMTTDLADKEIITLADASQMEQVLMNLATNARDAMPQGGQLNFRTKLVELDQAFIRAHGTGKPGIYALISVCDTGTGMTKETLEKVFDPFFTTKEPGKGTGLGLAMVYGIIKQHEGYITFYSEPGNGTCVHIYLPVAHSEKNASRETETEAALPVGGTETILVAEDDEKVSKLTEIILSQQGYTVITARDGEDAIQKFSDHKEAINLVILDVIMPKKSGREAYEAIRKIRPDIKIIFSSGYTAQMLVQGGTIPEKTTLINKPVPPKVLLSKIRTVLDS